MVGVTSGVASGVMVGGEIGGDLEEEYEDDYEEDDEGEYGKSLLPYPIFVLSPCLSYVTFHLNAYPNRLCQP